MDTVRIERFTSRVHAELACSMLTAHGLNARVSGDDVGGVHPDIPYGIGGTAIVVPRDQLEEASALLDEEFAGSLGDTDLEAGDASGGPAAPGGDAAGIAGAHLDSNADDGRWASSGRGAQRRRGLRTFAVLTATGVFVAFIALSSRLAGFWGG